MIIRGQFFVSPGGQFRLSLDNLSVLLPTAPAPV
jgi:hypothetical protein